MPDDFNEAGASPLSRRAPVHQTLSRSDLLAGLGLGGVALGLAHLQEALPLAGVLALAGVIGTLASGLALAGIHPFALDLGFVGAGGAYERSREHHCGGGGQSNAGHFSAIHLSGLLELIAIGFAYLREPTEAARPVAGRVNARHPLTPTGQSLRPGDPFGSARALYAEPKQSR